MAKYGPEIFQLKNGKAATMRHCAPDDAQLFPPFHQLISRETHFTLQVESKPPTVEKTREAWVDSENDPYALRIGVFVDGKLIAQLGFRAQDPSHPWTRHLGQFGMMVLKEYWGHGIGRQLLLAMEDFAKSIGISKIEAEVRTENTRGIHLYEAAGYLIEGTRKNAAFIDGRFHDEYYLGKVL